MTVLHPFGRVFGTRREIEQENEEQGELDFFRGSLRGA